MKKIIFALWIALSSFSLHAQTPYTIGDQVSSFSLMDADENSVSTDDYNNTNGFILIFIGNKCTYVEKYIDRIKALQTTFGNQGYQILLINPCDPTNHLEETSSHMQEFITEHNLNVPYLSDPNQQVTSTYQINSLPQAVVIQKVEGSLYLRYTGAIDDDPTGTHVHVKPLEEALDLLIAGEQVEHTQFPTVGCTVVY